MDITPLIEKDRQVMTHYGNGGFVVNATPHKCNILLLAHKVLPWQAGSFAEATAESLAPLLEEPLPEIVLIGTGAQFMPMPAGLREFFRSRQISADIMDTGAACRTYTVLLAEGRLVAAALIAV